MDPSNVGFLELAFLTVAYWVMGGALWIRRQRAAIRKEAFTVVAEDPATGARVSEVRGSLNLFRLAAAAFLPPLAVALLWSVFA